MAETLSSDALITWDRLKAELETSGFFDSDDRDRGIRFINAVSRRANSITRRKLKSRTYTDATFDGTGDDHLVLPQYPVTAVSAVSVDITRAFAATAVLDSDDYEYDEDTGILYIWIGTPKFKRCVRVTYTAGYVTAPDDLQDAIVQAVAYSWKKSVSKSFGVQSITGDGVTTQFEIDLPIPSMRIIESYKREPV